MRRTDVVEQIRKGSCKKLLKYDILTQTHNGVKSMLGLHFVSTGKLPIKIGKIFGTLFEKKHSGDYDDFAYATKN